MLRPYVLPAPEFIEYKLIDFEPVHLDYGAERAQQEFEKISKNATAYFEQRKKEAKAVKVRQSTPSCPGEVQAKKADLKAAGKKWFPYGYGPARGDSFVIEEVGYVSDDEEDYGDYQYIRNEQEDEIWQMQQPAGGSWFDEYQTVRVMKKELHKLTDG